MAILLVLLGSACGDPPENEMQQAQGAIDAARAVGADQYAPEEFALAQDALKHARDAVDQRDYRLALNHALDSRERAQNAAKQASDHKAKARVEADRVLTDASAALGEARLKLRAAETARVGPSKLNDARATIADGAQAVQKARAAFEQGDYPAVAKSASDAIERLRLTARDLDAMVPAAAHRRR